MPSTTTQWPERLQGPTCTVSMMQSAAASLSLLFSAFSSCVVTQVLECPRFSNTRKDLHTQVVTASNTTPHAYMMALDCAISVTCPQVSCDACNLPKRCRCTPFVPLALQCDQCRYAVRMLTLPKSPCCSCTCTYFGSWGTTPVRPRRCLLLSPAAPSSPANAAAADAAPVVC